MTQQELENKINDIITFLNDLNTNAKRNSDLANSATISDSSLIRFQEGLNNDNNITFIDFRNVMYSFLPARIVVDAGNGKFLLIKHPNNNNPLMYNVIEVNDIIQDGFWDNNTFWKLAICLNNTDVTLETNFKVLERIKGL